MWNLPKGKKDTAIRATGGDAMTAVAQETTGEEAMAVATTVGETTNGATATNATNRKLNIVNNKGGHLVPPFFHLFVLRPKLKIVFLYNTTKKNQNEANTIYSTPCYAYQLFRKYHSVSRNKKK